MPEEVIQPTPATPPTSADLQQLQALLQQQTPVAPVESPMTFPVEPEVLVLDYSGKHYIIGIAMVLLGIYLQLEFFDVMHIVIPAGPLGDISLVLILGALVVVFGLVLLFVRYLFARLIGLIFAFATIICTAMVIMYQSFFFGQGSAFDRQIQTPLVGGIDTPHTISNTLLIGSVVLQWGDQQMQHFADLSYAGDRVIHTTTSGNDTTYTEDTHRNMIQNIRTDEKLSLQPTTPTSLFFKGLIEGYMLDLTHTNTQTVSLNSPYMELLLTLPTKAIKVDISTIRLSGKIRVPKDVGIELVYRQWFGNFSLKDFQVDNTNPNRFVSNNYASATTKIQISLNSVYTNFSLDRY